MNKSDFKSKKELLLTRLDLQNFDQNLAKKNVNYIINYKYNRIILIIKKKVIKIKKLF